MMTLYDTSIVNVELVIYYVIGDISPSVQLVGVAFGIASASTHAAISKRSENHH